MSLRHKSPAARQRSRPSRKKLHSDRELWWRRRRSQPGERIELLERDNVRRIRTHQKSVERRQHGRFRSSSNRKLHLATTTANCTLPPQPQNAGPTLLDFRVGPGRLLASDCGFDSDFLEQQQLQAAPSDGAQQQPFFAIRHEPAASSPQPVEIANTPGTIACRNRHTLRQTETVRDRARRPVRIERSWSGQKRIGEGRCGRIGWSSATGRAVDYCDSAKRCQSLVNGERANSRL